jgi:outer membrane biosynthesis protein TonB
MRKRNEMASWGAVVIASIGLHAAAFGGMAGHASRLGSRPQRPATLVEMSVAPPKEVPLAAAAAPTATRKSMPRLAMSHAARAMAPRPTAPPPSVAPAPEAETPADFTGVTMTNDGPGAGWSSATGNGKAMTGAIGRPGARVGQRNVDGDSGARGSPSAAIVGEGDLSRRPSAPDLTGTLARAYPAEARKKGVSGKAVIRALILPNGRVAEMAMLAESGAGFGMACERTLRDSIWSPPLDRSARAVSTFIHYTCRFEVQ